MTLDLGRRARLGLPERGDRLLHARDRRLVLELRCRTDEAIELVDHAVAARGIEPGSLTLGTDNGTAFTSR